jgi:hypothetical protein
LLRLQLGLPKVLENQVGDVPEIVSHWSLFMVVDRQTIFNSFTPCRTEALTSEIFFPASPIANYSQIQTLFGSIEREVYLSIISFKVEDDDKKKDKAFSQPW